MQVTSKAVETLKEMIPADDLSNSTIRFFMAQGCCGPSLQMGLAPREEGDTTEFDQDGVRFSIEESAASAVVNVVLDADENGFRLDGYTAPACEMQD
jgi:Fe-S cluster assembly iron-binding protein IscA